LFAAQRLEKIKGIMLKYKTVDIGTLCSLLDVSDATVRKDLDKLEREGFLTKTHGGAILVEKEEIKDSVDIANFAEKEKVADLAIASVEEGDTIFLGPGYTCFLFAKKLKNIKNVTIITNNINAALELHQVHRNIFLIGGEIVSDDSLPYIAGFKALDYFNEVFVNKAYISVYGVDINAGFTVQGQQKLALLRRAIEVSQKIYIMADHTKFDKVGLYQLGKINSPDCVITNEKVGAEYKKFFFESDIKLLTMYDIL